MWVFKAFLFPQRTNRRLHQRWNAAKVFANLLDADSKLLCEGKNVLELGAGGALPGMVAALSGARRVRWI
jgi:nicotinamide N-methyltransferase